MKTTSARIASVLLIAIAVGFAVAHYRKPGSSGTAGERLTVYFTCDTAGRLEPCGCFTGQHGGLTRLASWLGARPGVDSALKVDVGGAVAGQADYDLIQYGYLARAYKRMGFAALNMGASEARLPGATLQQLAAGSAVPLVSASLVDATTRKELMEPYQIVEIQGTRIGILGVVSPDSVPEPGAGLVVLGLNEAIDRHLPELLAKTDMIVLLAFADEPEMRRLARDYYDIGLILGGDVRGPAQQIVRENQSLIVFTTNQARTVGTLTARLETGGRRSRMVDADYKIQLLWESIPQNPELLAMVKDFRSEIRTTPLAIDEANILDPNAIPGVSPTATYVGSASCAACHPQAHAVWANSGHASAFETLVKKGADADPHCIKCHSVGFERPGGYRRPLGGESTLTDVGCESCHGPASEHIALHVEGKRTQFKFRPVGPGDCTSCHYGEFSRPFDWDKFWPGISHGKEGTEKK